MSRGFRLTRTGFMLATTAAGAAVVMGDGKPDGKLILFWMLSVVTLGMVIVERA